MTTTAIRLPHKIEFYADGDGRCKSIIKHALFSFHGKATPEQYQNRFQFIYIFVYLIRFYQNADVNKVRYMWHWYGSVTAHRIRSQSIVLARARSEF